MGVSVILAFIVIIISCLAKRLKYGKYNLLDTWSRQYIIVFRDKVYILSLYHNALILIVGFKSIVLSRDLHVPPEVLGVTV